MLSMKKVCLVNLGDGRNYAQIDEGLGLASSGLEWIAAVLKEQGHEVDIVDQSFSGLSDQELLSKLEKLAPDLIGFNPLVNHRKKVQELTREIKERLSDVLTVIVGYDATFNSLQSYEGIDLLVRGKGELSMASLINNLQVSTRDKMQGVACRTEGAIQEKLDERSPSLPLEQLPLPYRSDEYLQELVERDEPMSIVASSGCDWNCGFCSTPAMYPKGREERPLNQVIAEIDHCASKGVKKFSFWDEDFFGRHKNEIDRANQIIEHIKHLEYSDGTIGGVIIFSFTTTPGVLMAERMGLLNEWEGVVNRIYIGVEGGCREALANLGNSSCTNPDINSRAINTVRSHNIGLQIGFIMINPHSTFDELEQSADFLNNNNESAVSMSFFHHLRPYPGTSIYSSLQTEGLLNEESASAEIDRYTDFPYQFAHDIKTEKTNMKDFAIAMGQASKDKRPSESDKLMNEIYMQIVAKGHGKKIFHSEDLSFGHGLVDDYHVLRKEVSDLNYSFFMQSLELFRDNNGKGFDELIGEYLQELDSYLIDLRNLKEDIKSRENILLPRFIEYIPKTKDRADCKGGLCLGG